MIQSTEAPRKRTRSTKPRTAKEAPDQPTQSSATTSPATKKVAVTRSRRSKNSKLTPVTPESRYHMIAEAAFFIAESHGFDPGRSLDDWLEAEVMIDTLIANNVTH